MKNLLLILAVLLIPAAAFAGEKTTPTGNKPATASAKKGKVKEKCVIPKLEHEEKLPSGETVIIKDPIPDNLSDKCYCQAVADRYITPSPRGGLVHGSLEMPDRAFRCIHLESPKGKLTKEIRKAIMDKDFDTGGASHRSNPANRKTDFE